MIRYRKKNKSRQFNFLGLTTTINNNSIFSCNMVEIYSCLSFRFFQGIYNTGRFNSENKQFRQLTFSKVN